MTTQPSSLDGLASLRRTAMDIQTLFSSRTPLPVIAARALQRALRATASADVVTNMFTFGPRSLALGPVVLYCPMGQPKLREFADSQALLAAVAEPGVLQQQVLAWMSASARTTYQGQGFKAPRFNSLDGLALLIDALASRPAALGDDEVSGDYGEHLYRSQVQAVLEQAQQQSVSNRENLWARRMEGVSLGLNSVMPFVTGPLAVAGWLLVAWGVHEQINALRTGEPRDSASSLAGFFLNMALVLMHYSAEPLSAARHAERAAEKEPVVPGAPGLTLGTETAGVPAAPVVQLTSMDAGRDAGITELPVEYSWAVPSTRLTASQRADLKTFAVSRPPEARRVTEGEATGLFQHKGRWYAEVGSDVFSVLVQRHAVRVVAANGRRGPWLKADANGRWSLDLTLRLRGGLPDETRVAQTAQALKRQFDSLHAAFKAVPVPDSVVIKRVSNYSNIERRLLGLDRENSTLTEYLRRTRLLLDLLEQLRRVEVVPDYAALRSGFLASEVRCLRLQISLITARRRTVYQQALSDPERVYTLSVRFIAETGPSAAFRQALSLVADVHARAVALCREQQASVEALLASVVPGDTQAVALDLPEWRGQAKVLAWKEAGLRPLVLRCLKNRARAPGLDALDILVDVNLRSRLKLSSYRRLCEAPGFVPAVRIRLLNEAIDEFAWLDTRLERVLSIPNDFIELSALAEYRDYLRTLREELIRDVLACYGQAGSLSGPSVGKSQVGGPVRLVHSSRFGTLVGRSGDDGDKVDFVDPYTRLVFAAFKKSQADSDWHYVPEPAKPSEWETRHYLNSLQLLRRADAALGRLPGLEANPRLSTRTIRGELEQLAQAMFEDTQASLAARNNAQGTDPLRELLTTQLNEKANRLITAGREAQQRMILAREPQAAGVEDLVAEGVVEIKEVPGTHRAPGSGTPPLFRSFYIQKVRADSAQPPQILWFAHFHYAPEKMGALEFTSAHLKPYDSPYESFGHQLRTAQGDNERLLKVYRASLDRAMAQALFFTDEVIAAQ